MICVKYNDLLFGNLYMNHTCWFFMLGNWFAWLIFHFGQLIWMGVVVGNLFMNACKVFEKMPKCIWMNVLMLKCIVFCFCYALIKVWRCLNDCKVFEKMSKCVRMNVLVLECIGFDFVMLWLKFEVRCLNACKVFEKMPKCVRMNVLVLECIDFSLVMFCLKFEWIFD